MMEVSNLESHGRLQWDPLSSGLRLSIKIAVIKQDSCSQP
jgi:hypothetical protein